MTAGEPAITLAATFFLAGTVVFAIGAVDNVRVWLMGADSVPSVIRGVLSVLTNPKALASLIAAFFRDVLAQRRLYRAERMRGLEKAAFIVFYISVILVNHVAADIATGVAGIKEFVAEFFRSPFFPGYIFALNLSLQGAWLVYMFLDNLCMLVIVGVEIIAAYRRLVRKHFAFTTAEDVIGLFMPIVWLVFRFFAEAVTIVKYGVPEESRYLFVAYALSHLFRGLAPETVEALFATLWPTSGFFLGVFMASFALSGRLWHAFAGPLTMLVNSLPRSHGGVRRG